VLAARSANASPTSWRSLCSRIACVVAVMHQHQHPDAWKAGSTKVICGMGGACSASSNESTSPRRLLGSSALEIWAPLRHRSHHRTAYPTLTITAHGLEKRYPTLVGITAWEFEQPRSILVFEQFSKSATWPQVVTVDEPSRIAADFPLGVVTGLDMCIQRFTQPSATYPFASYTAKETYVAVIHAKPKQRTMFNVQRLESVKDKLDGLDSFGQHRAALRGWSRGHHAIPFTKNVSGGRRQAAVHCQDDTFKKWPNDISADFRCGTPIEGPIKPSQIHARLNNGEAKGYWPLRVGANGWGEHTRFFITWAPTGKLLPMKRYDIVVDGIDPTNRRVMQATRRHAATGGFAQASGVAMGLAVARELTAHPVGAEPTLGGVNDGSVAPHLAQIDKLVFAAMHAQGAHAAQIAVAKDSKLKLVRSYTFAERNWPVTNAHHRMRMGSIAKLLMGMRACAEGQNFLHTPISDLLPALQLHMGYFAVLDRLEKYGASTNEFLRACSGSHCRLGTLVSTLATRTSISSPSRPRPRRSTTTRTSLRRLRF